MTTALTNSVNTYWAQVGEKLGTGTMVEYMKRFGMYADPKLNYPDGQMIASGVRNQAGDLVESGFDVGRVAIGQGGEEGQAAMTPMQMAEVAAAIANGGDLMKPNLLLDAKDPDGRTIDELDPDTAGGVVSEETAQQVTEMMVNVTEEGTAAGLSVGGVSFAGKTGTAEIDVAAGINRPWFIGFAPADDPQVAVAAMIEQCQGCTGGEVAGPIATAVMQSLLEG
jgi:peptidoglycan glycosyltransferase